jgi:hypothetical protein
MAEKEWPTAIVPLRRPRVRLSIGLVVRRADFQIVKSTVFRRRKPRMAEKRAASALMRRNE